MIIGVCLLTRVILLTFISAQVGNAQVSAGQTFKIVKKPQF
jgi:hypothetical protein